MEIDCYEHFDFDPAHLLPDFMIYSPVTDSTHEVSSSLWRSLKTLSDMWKVIVDYRTNTHDGQNLETAEIHMVLLDKYAEAKRVMQPLANQFCVAYKGYSLN